MPAASDFLIFSIAPKWVAKILAGEKTVELRRRGPKALQLPRPIAIIYATSPTCAVVATAEIGELIWDTPRQLWKTLGQDSGCTELEFNDYFANCAWASALKLQNVEALSCTISYRELVKNGERPPVSWRRVDIDSTLRNLR